ncbi:unnamed protein product [Didymodactylos carnosus]|uniref:ADP-ribosylglycohydrolase n=1 Tax=Didymodactylos carnosus TaxID=1234261 RepID=A0A814IZX0_9BILA|nr:unnamed protein product [Didymodactylos carnosus]CAF3800286.1 unnamed protein product [Didymodactylos carnosus]
MNNISPAKQVTSNDIRGDDDHQANTIHDAAQHKTAKYSHSPKVHRRSELHESGIVHQENTYPTRDDTRGDDDLQANTIHDAAQHKTAKYSHSPKLHHRSEPHESGMVYHKNAHYDTHGDDHYHSHIHDMVQHKTVKSTSSPKLHPRIETTHDTGLVYQESTHPTNNDYSYKTLTEDIQYKHDDKKHHKSSADHEINVATSSAYSGSVFHLQVPESPTRPESPNKKSKHQRHSRNASPATPQRSRSSSAKSRQSSPNPLEPFSPDSPQSDSQSTNRTHKKDKVWLNPQYDPSSNKIIQPDKIKFNLPPRHKNPDDNAFDRIAGSMLGMAIGDALGAHVEFRPHSFLQQYPVEQLLGGGTWGLNAGQWTDDTSMALCLAISLIVKRNHDAYDQMVRYKWWWKNGYMSSTGHCFDIGDATKESLQKFMDKQKTFGKVHEKSEEQMDLLSDEDSKLFESEQSTLCSDEGVAGNGALMRLAPIPLFFYRSPYYAIRYAGESALLTHGDVRAKHACRYYAALIVGALRGFKKDDLLAEQFYHDRQNEGWFGEGADAVLHQDIQKIADGSFKREGGYADGIRGTGYIVSSLEAALWAFWSDDNSFEKGALLAVNLGDDTDTTASIYGQLAGAYYKFNELPQKWLDKIHAKDFIICLNSLKFHKTIISMNQSTVEGNIAENIWLRYYIDTGA